MSDALIIDGVRSPRARLKAGALTELHPQELMGQVLGALAARIGVDGSEIDDVVIGSGSADGDHGHCIGRLAVLAAGWPVETAGVTISRHCGSGQQAVTYAAMAIQAGHQDAVIGGGVESMSHLLAPPITLDGDNLALRHRYPLVPQGISADLIAALEGFDRETVDAFALRSQRRAAVSADEGRPDRSVVPIHGADGTVLIEKDDILRPDTTADGLAGLTPSFAQLGAAVLPGFDAPFDDMARSMYPDVNDFPHVHHPGNSSALADGAGAILLTSSAFADARGLKARGRIVMSAVVGAEPVIMLTAPGPASLKCLERAGMTVADIDLWEINEAFAAVPLKTIRDLGIDPEKVNVNGGAIALGHPIGGTGPMLIQTALDELERTDKQTALITMCTGAGMATATIIERV